METDGDAPVGAQETSETSLRIEANGVTSNLALAASHAAIDAVVLASDAMNGTTSIPTQVGTSTVSLSSSCAETVLPDGTNSDASQLPPSDSAFNVVVAVEAAAAASDALDRTAASDGSAVDALPSATAPTSLLATATATATLPSTTTPTAATPGSDIETAPSSINSATEHLIPPKPRKLAATSTPRRLRSGSGNNNSAGSSTTVSVVLKRGSGVRDRTSSGNGASSATPTTSGGGGIVSTSSQRRHRAAGLTRQGSSDDDFVSASAAAVGTPKKLKPKKMQHHTSLRNVATLVRSNLRQSIRDVDATTDDDATDADADDPQPIDRDPSLERKSSSSTFAGIAHQVVTSKRAAKGFIAMWAKDSALVTHVFKGIHMEKKKLDLKTVAAEYKEIKRRQFYQELVVYLVFLTLFFSTLAWLPVHESYEQNDAVGALTCREHGVCELRKLDDIYAFATTLADSICDRKGVNAQWVRVGGVRFRQVRVQQQQCHVYSGFATPCYPFYDRTTEDRTTMYSNNDKNRTYAWRDGLGPLQPELYHSLLELFSPLESYGNGGYAVDLCTVDVDDLQDDAWLNVATRAVALEFTLVNPVTRVFTLGLHVFTLSPSGHMEHYPHSSHLRVIGLETNDDVVDKDDDVQTTPLGRVEHVVDAAVNALRRFDHRILLWLLLILFLITYSIGEVTEMSTMGASTYLKSDLWNVFELSHLTLLAFFIVYMARFYMASTAFALDLDAVVRSAASSTTEEPSVEGLDRSSTQSLLRNYQRLSDVASLAAAMSLLKVFKFLRMNSTLNLLWRVLGMAMRDLMGFLVIFNLIFLGYSAMGSYAFGFALEEFSTIGKSYGTCFQMLAGEVDYSRLSQANPRLAPVFIGTFVVLVFQILVNMFVAILSEYYESAKNDDSDEDVEYDVLTRVRNYLRACAPTVVATKNEVIRLIPKQTVRLISTNLVDQEETRQRAKKLFRGAVWRVVALLRFGMKFDRRIQFGDRKQPAHIGAGANKNDMTTHIRLSENFDHKSIKDMVPVGITIHLKGDSLLGDGIALKVLRHNKLSVECVVLDNDEGSTGGSSSANAARRTPLSVRSLSAASSFDETDLDGVDTDVNDEVNSPASPLPVRERVLELLGGEKLRIPWQIFVFHVVRSSLKELRMGLLRAIKLWHYARPQLVDDYHLGLIFEDLRADGRSSLRYDEVYRMLDLYLRKDQRKSLTTQAEVRQEALEVMYRFRKCLIDMPSREKEGHNYRPKPVDTSSVVLGQLEYLGDMLARNCHDMWALERLKQGWSYGAQRDDAKKKHPNLIPYKLLSPEEQAFDYRSSLETLKTIVFMNYSVVRLNASHSGSFQDATTSSATLVRSTSALSDGAASDNSSTSPSTSSSRSLLLPSGTSSVGVVAATGAAALDAAPTSVSSCTTAGATTTTNSDAENNKGSNSSALPASPPPSAPMSTPTPTPTPTAAAAAPESKGKKPVPALLREAMSFRRSSLMEDSPYFTTYGENNSEVYRPLPIDTSTIDLPPRLLRLVDLLSENAHEVWAKGRMDEGWTYGPQRADAAKKHPCLVPYIFLTDEEKEYDLNIAKETLKTLLAMKFTLVDRSSKY